MEDNKIVEQLLSDFSDLNKKVLQLKNKAEEMCTKNELFDAIYDIKDDIKSISRRLEKLEKLPSTQKQSFLSKIVSFLAGEDVDKKENNINKAVNFLAGEDKK
jgi:hypothetical protein